jgi:hypothetical protein
MTKKEFMTEAVLRIGAALVKVMDEQAIGILNEDRARKELAINAWLIAQELTAFAEKELID